MCVCPVYDGLVNLYAIQDNVHGIELNLTIFAANFRYLSYVDVQAVSAKMYKGRTIDAGFE
ncbi:putative nucleic acid-binding Zn finger protein [Pontibacter aydingkolensis]